MTLIIILAVLFATLAIAVTLLEKSSFRMSDASMAKWSRWIVPLIAISLLIQLIRMLF